MSNFVKNIRMYTIGHILRELREDKGLLIPFIETKTGIDPTLLSRIETGKRLPTPEQVSALANVYGFDERKLLVQREPYHCMTR